MSATDAFAKTAADKSVKDLVLQEPVREPEEISRLRHENQELRDRILQLESDQAMILDINQMLLEKLHLLSEDFLAQPPGRGMNF
jgi:cell division protein FtsB